MSNPLCADLVGRSLLPTDVFCYMIGNPKFPEVSDLVCEELYAVSIDPKYAGGHKLCNVNSAGKCRPPDDWIFCSNAPPATPWPDTPPVPHAPPASPPPTATAVAPECALLAARTDLLTLPVEEVFCYHFNDQAVVDLYGDCESFYTSTTEITGAVRFCTLGPNNAGVMRCTAPEAETANGWHDCTSVLMNAPPASSLPSPPPPLPPPPSPSPPPPSPSPSGTPRPPAASECALLAARTDLLTLPDEVFCYHFNDQAVVDLYGDCESFYTSTTDIPGAVRFCTLTPNNAGVMRCTAPQAETESGWHDCTSVLVSPSPPPSASPSPPPSASPSPPPSLSPSPPLQSQAYPGCSASDLLGDLDGSGVSSVPPDIRTHLPGCPSLQLPCEHGHAHPLAVSD